MDFGQWCAIDIELEFRQVEAATQNLLKMKELFEKECCPPCSLCVICGMTTYPYTHHDGVIVVSINLIGGLIHSTETLSKKSR